jgi:DNA (cytosine-5)-methyltransferase 1
MWQFVRMVREMQPCFFCIENVRGILSFKDFFRLLLKTLEKCGYVVRFNLIDCAGYGVPQKRHRVLIDGARNDLNLIPVYPKPTFFDPEKLKAKDGHSIPAALVADKCFAVHG